MITARLFACVLAIGLLVAGSSGHSVEQSDEDTTVIKGSRHTASYDCNGKSFEIKGTGNTITLKGECNRVTVGGTKNEVDIEAVSAIKVHGVENRVTWERGRNGKDPQITKSGLNNVVSQRKK